MRAFRYLVVIDETLAGDEFSRVSRFLSDIATVCPVRSVSGLIRHVEQFAPIVGLPMLAGDPSLASATGVPLLAMRYTPCEPCATDSETAALSRDQLSQRLTEILQHCSSDADRTPAPSVPGFVPGDLTKIVPRYEMIVCVRPKCGEGATLTHGDQLVCQLAESSQQPLWRCPRQYDGIRRVVVAWPDAATGESLLVSAASIADVWNVPFCVLSAGDKNHQRMVDGDVQAVREQIALPKCEVLTCDCLEDIAKCVNSDDLLVMGAYGRWWPWRLVLASHTETILQDLNCPALLLPGRHDSSSHSSDQDVRSWFTSVTPKEATNARAPQ